MKAKDISTTLLKGLDVLRCYQDGAHGLTIAEISKRTGFERAITRRLCLTLVHAGFMVRVDRWFILSPRIVTLAGNFFQANDFGHNVQPVLNRYAQELEGELGLAVRDGSRALYVAQSSLVETQYHLA